VLCLDGTWNRAETPPGVASSNAAQVARFVRGDGVPQSVYYQPGLGTASLYDSQVRAYFGWGITDKIRGAYSFLAENWRPGDEIFLFGISRGAFAALTVSRLLGRYGLPPAPRIETWEEIWTQWLADQDFARPGWITPRVDFLGAWDTVEALGAPFPGFRGWTGPQVGPRGQLLGATVARAFHALAFHEQSIAFRPTIWKAPFPPGARVEQRWFRGTHADICGGFGKPALADVSLAWMLGRAREAGLELDEALLARGLHPAPLAPHSPVLAGTRRLLPRELRSPGQTSPESETMDEALLREIGAAKPTS
jgi:uncharacterized protein (DUF2235 family)